MPEPLLPVPSPEPDSNWESKPMRCPLCGEILDPRGWGKGWCQFHGIVKVHD